MKIDKSLNIIAKRLDYLEGGDGNGNNNDYGNGGHDDGKHWDDPIGWYKEHRRAYYFHPSYYEKHWLSIEEYKQDIALHPHCKGLTDEEYKEGKKNGCIPECPFYNPNPTYEEARAVLLQYYPDDQDKP